MCYVKDILILSKVLSKVKVLMVKYIYYIKSKFMSL